MFATGSMNEGKALENVQLRIGGPRENENDVTNCKLGDLRCMRRALGAYMSQRDLQQMTIKSIETADKHTSRGPPPEMEDMRTLEPDCVTPTENLSSSTKPPAVVCVPLSV